MELTHEQKETLASELEGTSGVYDHEFAKSYGADFSDLEEILGDFIFKCEGCGWWCGNDELYDDNKCEDCYDEEQERSEEE